MKSKKDDLFNDSSLIENIQSSCLDICEFDFDFALNEFNFNEDYIEEKEKFKLKEDLNKKENFSVSEIKQFLFYVTGRKISKKEIINTAKYLCSNDSNIEEAYNGNYNVKIPKNIFKEIYNYYMKKITFKEILKSFANFYLGDSSSNLKGKISFEQFYQKNKTILPNISDDIFTQIFLYISDGKPEITYSDLQKITFLDD